MTHIPRLPLPNGVPPLPADALAQTAQTAPLHYLAWVDDAPPAPPPIVAPPLPAGVVPVPPLPAPAFPPLPSIQLYPDVTAYEFANFCFPLDPTAPVNSLAGKSHKALQQARFACVPAFLRQFPNFGLYTPLKHPYTLHAAQKGWFPSPGGVSTYPGDHLRVNEPATWCRYEDAVDARYNKHFEGPAFVLAQNTKDAGVLGIDLDDPVKHYTENERYKDLTDDERTARIQTAQRWIHRIMLWALKNGAWIERSRGGSGAHIFVRADLPLDITRFDFECGGSIYSRDQYIALTCKMVQGSATDLPLCQAAVNELIHALRSRDFIKAINPKVVDLEAISKSPTPGSRDDLTIEEVLAEFKRQFPNVFASLDWVYPNGGTGWSAQMRRIVGDLDKITSRPQQIFDILSRSWIVTHSGPGRSGEERPAKLERAFAKYWLIPARASNAVEVARRIAVQEHGAAQMANIANQGKQ